MSICPNCGLSIGQGSMSTTIPLCQCAWNKQPFTYPTDQSKIATLESELSALRKELEEATERYAENEASNKAVELALSDIKYTGSYADGVRQLIKELEERCQSIDRLDGKLQEANRHQISAYLEYQAMCKELEEAKEEAEKLRVNNHELRAESRMCRNVVDAQYSLASSYKYQFEQASMELDCAKNRVCEELSTLTAERNRLAAQIKEAVEQEPVAWMVPKTCDEHGVTGPYCYVQSENPSKRDDSIPLYPTPPIRKGWVMVPLEPDYQMCAAGLVACPVMGLSINALPIIYKAMIAAVKKDTL